MSRRAKRRPAEPRPQSAPPARASAPVVPAEAPPTAPAPPPSTPAAFDLRIAVALAIAVVILYWPVHGYDFIRFDDPDYVQSNPPVLAGLTWSSITWAFSNLQAGFWIPLTWLSFMLDTQLFGTGAGGYHVTNVLLHAVNAVGLFALLAGATGRRWESAFVAALFALHPQRVESVAWVTERKDVLSTLFLLLTLWCYGVYARRPSIGRYVLTVALYVLGLTAKPMLTTLPFLLLCIDLWPLGRFTRWPTPRLLLEKLPFLFFSGGSAVMAMVGGHHVDASAPFAGVVVGDRLANAAQSVVLYLLRMVAPVGLAVLYPEHPPPPWWQTAATVALLGAVTAGALRLRSSRPYLIAGWLWYLMALVPVSGIVKFGHFALADRFTYVALLGVYVAIAWGAGEWVTGAGRRTAASVAAAIALIGSAACTALQVPYWRDTVTLFQRTIAVTGPNPVAHYILGLEFAERGDRAAAIAHYTEALRLRPGYAHAESSLGLVLFEQGRVDEAIAHYEAALQVEPTEPYAHANLGLALERKGRAAEALDHFARASWVEPRVASFRLNYGRALATAGRRDEAVVEYRAALALAPDSAEAHNNFANLLADQGQADEAFAHYGAALRARPDYATGHANLANFLAQHGRFDDAVAHYTAALRLTPDDAPLRSDLGNALAASGKLDDAVAQYTEALRRQPDNAGTHINLANALAMLGRVDDGLAQYREALALDPSRADAHFNWGIVLEEHGQVADAISHYTAALKIRPDYAEARERLQKAQAAHP